MKTKYIVTFYLNLILAVMLFLMSLPLIMVLPMAIAEMLATGFSFQIVGLLSRVIDPVLILLLGIGIYKLRNYEEISFAKNGLALNLVYVIFYIIMSGSAFLPIGPYIFILLSYPIMFVVALIPIVSGVLVTLSLKRAGSTSLSVALSIFIVLYALTQIFSVYLMYESSVMVQQKIDHANQLPNLPTL